MKTMDKMWACLVCGHKFRFGDALFGTYPNIQCPNCKAENNHPIGDDEIIVPEYHGEIGTIQ